MRMLVQPKGQGWALVLPALLAILLGAGASLVGRPGPVAAAEVNSLALSATYEVDATLRWGDRSVSVATIARVTNTTLAAVYNLAFNLTPLRLGNAQVGTATVDGQPAPTTTIDQAVLVALDPPLAPGATAAVQIDYQASLNASSRGDRWLFTRSGGLLAAYRWIPWLSRQVAWDGSNNGDPWVTASSPYVEVTLTTDRPMSIAATGQRVAVSADGLTQTFVASDVRDFNFSAAPGYRTRSQTVAIGTQSVTVTFYYRSLRPGPVLRWAASALRDFSARVGSYAYPQLNIGEVGYFADAIESPGHFWLPVGWSSALTRWTVVHEIAHVWFYGVVGNDQASEPFADEAVAEFMSSNLVGQWGRPDCAQQNLDQSVYDLGDCYESVIYAQGSRYLRDYRDTVGEATFWRGLANYYAAYGKRIGGTRQLLDALDSAAATDYPHWLRFPSLYPDQTGG